MANTDGSHQKALIGDMDHDYWIFDSRTGFDLTRPYPPTSSPPPYAIKLSTTTSSITVDPRRSAIVIIDMQNFFLSTALGRPPDSKGLKAQKQLLMYIIPAARKAEIQIAWVNWGLTEQDLQALPPATLRVFGFNTMSAEEFESQYSSAQDRSTSSSQLKITAASDLGKDTRIYKGPGRQLGNVTLSDGKTIPAGRALMQAQWNTELSPPLLESFKSSLSSPKPDVWLDKSRISGMHVLDTPTGVYLRAKGIKTLFFAGVNTDQCVFATLTDAYCQGFDCIMLKDACATTSPGDAQECIEFNAQSDGFVTDCQSFARDVEAALARAN